MSDDATRLWSGRRWERRRAARRLARAGTPAAVATLVTAAAHGILAGPDRRLAGRVRRAITGVTDPVLIDAVWESVLANGDGLLAETVAAAGRQHSDGAVRTAAALLAGDSERYRELDPAGAVLGAMHGELSEAARAGLARRARAAGCAEWVRAVTGQGSLTDAEWAAVVAILRDRAEWDRLWRLTRAAPPAWGGPMLRVLADSGWEPADPAFHRLRDRLPRAAVRPDGWVPADPTPLSGLEGRVRQVAVTPDGRQVCASTGGAVQLWSLPSPRPQTISRQPLTAGRLLAVVPDGSLLIADGSGGPGPIARSWQLPSGAEAGEFTAPLDSVNRLVLTADGGHLVAGDRTGAVQVCAVPSGRAVAGWPGGGPAVSSLAASANGEVIASGHTDGAVRVWSRVSGHVRTLRLRRLVQSVLLPAGGGILAGADGRITAWDLPGLPLTRRMTPRMIGNAPGSVLATPDGQLLLAGASDGVQTWRLATGEFHRLLPFPGAPAWHFAILADGRLLAGTGSDAVQLWRLPDGAPEGILAPGDGARIEHVAADRAGRTLVTAGDALIAWRLWNEDLRELSRRPLAAIDPGDLRAIRATTAGERAWLALVTELLRAREESE